MADDFNAKEAADRISAEFKEVFYPPAEGASLGAILGTAIMQQIFREAGLQVVPREPNLKMEQAFQAGRFKPFGERYRAMLEVV